MIGFVALLMTGAAQDPQEWDLRARVYSYDGTTWAPYASRPYPQSSYNYSRPRSFCYYSYPSYSYPSYGFGVYGMLRYAYPQARPYGYAPSYRAYPGARHGVHHHRGHGLRR